MPQELNHLQTYLVDEFLEDYQEHHLTRRDALRRIAFVTGSFVVATNLIAACSPAPAPVAQPAATVPPPPTPTPPPPTATPGSATAQGEAVQFPSGDATIIGYLARPAGPGPFPAVLVCHENRGLTEHIKDVTRRLAGAKYVALAVDLLSREGGTDKVTDAARIPGILGNSPPDRMAGDFRSGWTYLQTQPQVQKGVVGMVGFCFGGGMTWLTATKMPDLKAAVPFYGPNPPLTEVPNINAAVLAMYGALDQRINQGIPAIEDAMKQNNKTFEKMVYPNANHAFFNDTGQNYNADAAKDAWTRTLAWFEKYLKA